MKYAPVFPDRLGSIHHARAFLAEFVQSYNHEHHHSGIGLHTAADVHYGLAGATTVARSQAFAKARAAHPERFSNHNNPKILDLPEAARINPPPAETPEPAASA